MKETFMLLAEDGTICQLALVSQEGDGHGEFKVALQNDGIIGGRETVAYLLERIHRLYPKSEFATAGKAGAILTDFVLPLGLLAWIAITLWLILSAAQPQPRLSFHLGTVHVQPAPATMAALTNEDNMAELDVPGQYAADHARKGGQ